MILSRRLCGVMRQIYAPRKHAEWRERERERERVSERESERESE